MVKLTPERKWFLKNFRGEGVGKNVTWHFFPKNSHFLVVLEKKSRVTWGWGTGQCYQMTQGGLKLGKKCHVLFEWPLILGSNLDTYIWKLSDCGIFIHFPKFCKHQFGTFKTCCIFLQNLRKNLFPILKKTSWENVNLHFPQQKSCKKVYFKLKYKSQEEKRVNQPLVKCHFIFIYSFFFCFFCQYLVSSNNFA